MRKILLLIASTLLIAACGSPAAAPTENFGPKPLTGPAVPAVANPKLDTPPLSVPRARPLPSAHKPKRN